jgi:hypothetical protein
MRGPMRFTARNPKLLHIAATRSMQRLGIIPSGMLVGIGCVIGIVIAIAMMRSAKARSKQNRNRILRDYVRRTY